ncbi:type II toxin-antitoxin system VapC family toxin [Enterovirga rhinocerotis]|uniref:Ribonuclease VapC n=1 Tax=Enterovirga rhinocerotis TaxID=1339210 RepID=A0A4R7CCM4_9HYPH|nr:type II toxin-antitoxin system VapC family toxin [Enterovirga rhinocerotis]TDR94567.1 tRNA(fMet)-specific endonuclease VapC [Enterovirga rhinocerotis]
MRYLFDTNAVIALLRGHEQVDRLVRACTPDDIVLSAIVAYELHFGARKSARYAENDRRVRGLGFTVLDFTEEDARWAGDVRAKLEAAGTPIGPHDILIAGQALRRDLIVVTRNIREFQRVEGLAVEDWETS